MILLLSILLALLLLQEPRPVPEIALDTMQGTVAVITPRGLGTGISLPEGILTNNHVVEHFEYICLQRYHTPDGDCEAVGRVVLADAEADLALIATYKPWPALKLGWSGDLRVGDPVLAIGYAYGLMGFPSVTQGIFSALRSHRAGLEVQFDATAAPGNSGGPLVSLETGDVVGMVYKGYAPSGGTNLAISAEDIHEFLKRWDKHEWPVAPEDLLDIDF